MRRPNMARVGLSVPHRRGAGLLPRSSKRGKLLGIGWRGRRSRVDSPVRDWMAGCLMVFMITVFTVAMVGKFASSSVTHVPGRVYVGIIATPFVLVLVGWTWGRLDRVRGALGDERFSHR